MYWLKVTKTTVFIKYKIREVAIIMGHSIWQTIILPHSYSPN